MAIYQDLIEEVARIHGYDNIQISLPVIDVKLAKYQDQFELAQLRQTVVTLGYQEAISFSFADAKIGKTIESSSESIGIGEPNFKRFGSDALNVAFKLDSMCAIQRESSTKPCAFL